MRGALNRGPLKVPVIWLLVVVVVVVSFIIIIILRFIIIIAIFRGPLLILLLMKCTVYQFPGVFAGASTARELGAWPGNCSYSYTTCYSYIDLIPIIYVIGGMAICRCYCYNVRGVI